MLADIIGALWGPTAVIVAFVASIGAALIAGRRQGASSANSKRDADDMEDAYNRERTRDEIERNSASTNARDRLRKSWRRD